MSYQPSRRSDISYGSYQPDFPNISSIKPISAPTFDTGRLPAGGGKLNPIMARDSPTSYGSYPPRSTTHDRLIPTRERSIRSYNQNPYGDFPPSRSSRASSTPMYDDPGYPRGSRMEQGYESYKAANGAAGRATTSYKNEAAKLAVPHIAPDGAAYGAVKGKYYYPEDHAKLAGSADRAVKANKFHTDARREFNSDHIGRLSRGSYKGHRHQANLAAASLENHTMYENVHRNLSTRTRFP